MQVVTPPQQSQSLSLRGRIMAALPWYIRKKLQYYFRYHVPAQEQSNALRVKKIREQGYANVLFIASTLPMWRYEEIMRLMIADERFNVSVALCSINEYAKEERAKCINDLKTYFESESIKPIDADDPDINLKELFADKDFDIIFYPQPYDGIYGNELEFEANRERLFCHCPYGMQLNSDLRFINSEFFNYAWKIFHCSPAIKKRCRRFMLNDGKNVVVIGESHYDLIRSLKNSPQTPWNQQEKPKKKVIWAPHFSMVEGQTLFRNAFAKFHRIMLEIAREYQDDIQFVFKPHPRLKTQLYSMANWGKNRADAYFEEWNSLPNAQVYTGSYESLFAHSDAMIHDCNSFAGEYLFTGNPVLYITENAGNLRASFNELGNKCLDAHYFANSESDIRAFIDKVVLKGEDNMKSQREQLVKEEFTINDGLTVGQRMYQNICKDLKFDL